MNEYLINAREELKRVDHLIYVSLKYTRTADVLKSVIERLVNCYSRIICGLLQRIKSDKKIDDFPKVPALQVEEVIKWYPNDKLIADSAQLYLFLRKANNSEHKGTMEYRRNVTMTIMVEGKPFEVTIDDAMKYYKDIQLFMEYIEEKKYLDFPFWEGM